MAMPEKLDHCPRDPGCTSRSVWRDKETQRLYSLKIKKCSPLKGKPRLDSYQTTFVDHICTNVVADIPTTFFMGEWYNPRTKRTRFIGASRLVRSALTPPIDRKNEWELVKLHRVDNVDWQEEVIPEEFEHVSPRAKANT